MDRTPDSESLACVVTDLGLAQKRIPALVATLGLGIRRMELDEPSLEDVFVKLVGRGGA